jgi:Acetyltransferase (GNAT) domain
MRASGACTAALGVPGELIPPAPRSRFEAVDSYGVIRRCRTGFKVGPLLSETEEEADVLFLDPRLGKRADACQTRDTSMRVPDTRAPSPPAPYTPGPSCSEDVRVRSFVGQSAN